MQIFYTPTRTNEAVVEKLKLIPVLQAHEFKRLEYADWRRRVQIESIKGDAAFIWGDGNQHHESFHFTDPVRSIKLKINVDMHSDMGSKNDTNLACWNHMGATENAGIKIITTPYKHGTRQAILDAKFTGIQYEKGEIALTIDLDGVCGMPAYCPQWISAFTPPVEEVIKLIKTLGNRITRMDIGGLFEDLDYFSIVELPKGYIPSVDELNGVISGIYVGNDEITVSPDAIQKIWNRVGTYVTYAIADLLDEFARAIGEGK